MYCQRCSKPNFTPVGQNGVDVPYQNAKLPEQGKIHQCVYLFILFVYMFLFFRKCKSKLETVCGMKRIKEEAYCYTKGSKCEMKYKKGEFKHFYESNPDKRVMTK